MLVFAIRHTKPEVPPGQCYGRRDVDLAASYPEELEAALARLLALHERFAPVARAAKGTQATMQNAAKANLAGLSAMRVISSPLKRCARLARDMHAALAELQSESRSAEQVAQLSKHKVVFDERLQELDFGDWEGQDWDAIAPAELNAWGADFVERAPPGGESYRTLFERIAQWEGDWSRERLARASHSAPEDNADPSLLLVSHGGPLRALLALWTGIPLRETFQFQIDPGSLVCFRLGQDSELRGQLLAWNA